jgi:hypothetical protein
MQSAKLRTGTAIVIAAALWAGLDAAVHVRADEVEPLRIVGNIAVWVACGVSLAAVRLLRAPQIAGAVSGVAAVLVLGLNLAWGNEQGELPGPAAVFFGLAVVLLLLATWRFFGEAAEARAETSATSS